MIEVGGLESFWFVLFDVWVLELLCYGGFVEVMWWCFVVEVL